MSQAAEVFLRAAQPFTVITEPDTVRLLAGEDMRYTLRAVGLDQWLPALLTDLCAGLGVEASLLRVSEGQRPSASSLLKRLREERVFIPRPLVETPAQAFPRLVITGENALAECIKSTLSPNSAGPPAAALYIHCQDTLDYQNALARSVCAIADGAAFLWVTEAPLARAFISPVFLPDAGPCLACLLQSFKRLSPTPELYDSLRTHAENGGIFTPTSIGSDARLILAAIASFKVKALCDPPMAYAEALFRLHVLDVKSFEVSTHPLSIDPDCPSDNHAL